MVWLRWHDSDSGNGVGRVALRVKDWPWQFLGMVEEGKGGCVRSRKPTQQVSRGARMSEMSEMNVKLLTTTLESRHVVVLVRAQGTGTG